MCLLCSQTKENLIDHAHKIFFTLPYYRQNPWIGTDHPLGSYDSSLTDICQRLRGRKKNWVFHHLCNYILYPKPYIHTSQPLGGKFWVVQPGHLGFLACVMSNADALTPDTNRRKGWTLPSTLSKYIITIEIYLICHTQCQTRRDKSIHSTALVVQNMAGEIFVHACHILKRAETCLVASQNIYY